mgnify:CR=1 FL=1
MWGILILKCKKTSLKHVALRGGVLAFSVGRGGGCALERVVGMEMVGATGGASPLPYEKWVG